MTGEDWKVYKRIIGELKIYPDLAAPVTLQSNAAAWTLGNFAEIVPASTITKKFVIVAGCFCNPDTNACYSIKLYYGASDLLCATLCLSRTGVMNSSLEIPTYTNIIPANSRIRAKIADSVGNAQINIKIRYIEMSE